MSERYDPAEYPITPHDVWQVLRFAVEAIRNFDSKAVEDAMTGIANMSDRDWMLTGFHADCKRQLARIARARAREEEQGDG